MYAAVRSEVRRSGLQCSRLSEDSGPAGLETGPVWGLRSMVGMVGRIYIIVYINKELPWYLTPSGSVCLYSCCARALYGTDG